MNVGRTCAYVISDSYKEQGKSFRYYEEPTVFNSHGEALAALEGAVKERMCEIVEVYVKDENE